MIPPPTRSTLFPYTTLFRSKLAATDPSHKGIAMTDRRPFLRSIFDAAVAAAHPDVVLASRLRPARSEEHTSELQSRRDLVCRLLLEKKKYKDGNTCINDVCM